MTTALDNVRDEYAALATFVTLLGFDAVKVATAFALKTDNRACNCIAVSALTVGRDFSKSPFSPTGVDAANKFLDSLLQQ